MSEYNFTIHDVIREVRALAAEQPDFVYSAQPERAGYDHQPECSYLGAVQGEEGGKACIVGQALARLGVSRDDLLAVEGRGASAAILEQLGERQYRGIWSEQEQWLNMVQSHQDYGDTWSGAVESADETVGVIA